MSENDFDCPNCGKPMLWKCLKKPLCPSCDAEEVENVYSSKTDMSEKQKGGMLMALDEPTTATCSKRGKGIHAGSSRPTAH